MNIVFTGTHCTGKTTLLNILKDQSRLSDVFTFVSETTRTLRDAGKIAINENGDDESQIILALKNYEIAVVNKNFISDRCLLDVLCYTKYMVDHGKCKQETLAFVESLFTHTHYDVLFYLEPEFRIISDGTRSENNSFRDDVMKNFRYYIEKYSLPVIRLSSTIDQRLTQIRATLTDSLSLL